MENINLEHFITVRKKIDFYIRELNFGVNNYKDEKSINYNDFEYFHKWIKKIFAHYNENKGFFKLLHDKFDTENFVHIDRKILENTLKVLLDKIDEISNKLGIVIENARIIYVENKKHQEIHDDSGLAGFQSLKVIYLNELRDYIENVGKKLLSNSESKLKELTPQTEQKEENINKESNLNENEKTFNVNDNFVNENQIIIFNRLNFLKGNNHLKDKIMNEYDFKRLFEYTCYLVENKALPEKIKPIPQINISSQDIRYTFYLIHKDIFTTRKILDVFINFIHSVFIQFNETEKTTTKKKFSEKPQYYDSLIS